MKLRSGTGQQVELVKQVQNVSFWKASGESSISNT